MTMGKIFIIAAVLAFFMTVEPTACWLQHPWALGVMFVFLVWVAWRAHQYETRQKRAPLRDERYEYREWDVHHHHHHYGNFESPDEPARGADESSGPMSPDPYGSEDYSEEDGRIVYREDE